MRALLHPAGYAAGLRRYSACRQKRRCLKAPRLGFRGQAVRGCPAPLRFFLKFRPVLVEYSQQPVSAPTPFRHGKRTERRQPVAAVACVTSRPVPRTELRRGDLTRPACAECSPGRPPAKSQRSALSCGYRCPSGAVVFSAAWSFGCYPLGAVVFAAAFSGVSQLCEAAAQQPPRSSYAVAS
jgi:hypothetical protein